MQEEETFITHWDLLKPLLKAKWSRVTDKDLSGVKPLFDELVAVIQAKYQHVPKKTIIQELENLRQQILK